jgi:hypothetical protein
LRHPRTLDHTSQSGRRFLRYREEWYAQQCGACSFYVPLAGGYGMDWGACTNDRSVFDGRVMFEHDGCEEHSPAEEWVSAYDIEDLLGDT